MSTGMFHVRTVLRKEKSLISHEALYNLYKIRLIMDINLNLWQINELWSTFVLFIFLCFKPYYIH